MWLPSKNHLGCFHHKLLVNSETLSMMADKLWSPWHHLNNNPVHSFSCFHFSSLSLTRKSHESVGHRSFHKLFLCLNSTGGSFYVYLTCVHDVKSIKKKTKQKRYYCLYYYFFKKRRALLCNNCGGGQALWCPSSASVSVLQGASSAGRGPRHSPRLWTRWQALTMMPILFDTEQTAETFFPPAGSCGPSAAVQLQRKAQERCTTKKRRRRRRKPAHQVFLMCSYIRPGIGCRVSVQTSIMQLDVVLGAARVVDLRGGATGDLSDCAVLLPWWWLVFTISTCKLETGSPSITAGLRSIEWLLLVNIIESIRPQTPRDVCTPTVFGTR